METLRTQLLPLLPGSTDGPKDKRGRLTDQRPPITLDQSRQLLAAIEKLYAAVAGLPFPLPRHISKAELVTQLGMRVRSQRPTVRPSAFVGGPVGVGPGTASYESALSQSRSALTVRPEQHSKPNGGRALRGGGRGIRVTPEEREVWTGRRISPGWFHS